MNPLSDASLRAAKETLRKATRKPWKARIVGEHREIIEIAGPSPKCVIVHWAGFDSASQKLEMQRRNAEAIVTAVNLGESLIDEVLRLRAEAEQLHVQLADLNQWLEERKALCDLEINRELNPESLRQMYAFRRAAFEEVSEEIAQGTMPVLVEGGVSLARAGAWHAARRGCVAHPQKDDVLVSQLAPPKVRS